MFAIRLSLENVERSFKIFHSEPLTSQTQILNSAELVDRFDFSAKTLAKTV